MPVPTPKQNEKKEQYMHRCMTFMHNEQMGKPEKDRMPQDQQVAVCFTTFRKHTEKANTEATQEGETDVQLNKEN